MPRRSPSPCGGVPAASPLPAPGAPVAVTSGCSPDEIAQKTEVLAKVSQELGTAMYAASQAESGDAGTAGAGTTDGGASGTGTGDAGGSDDDVVDAEVVDEDK